MLISFENLSFGYNDTLILDNVSFAISENEHIGLIGGNGEGKTTLLKLILGQLSPLNGKSFQKNNLKIGYLEQNGGFDSNKTVLSEMQTIFQDDFQAIENLRKIEKEISHSDPLSSEYKRLCDKYDTLNKVIIAHDAYHIDVKIKTVLNGMGFQDFYDQEIATMSGGEKTRLKLCRLLLEEPEILILDEPTNHLDIKTLFWLEDYLSTYQGSIFTVSHDRYFLDHLVTKIFELEDCQLSIYRGNYSKYKILKAEKVAYQLKEYEKQQVEIAHMQDYVDRNLVRATTAKSALSRVKKLESMERIEKPKKPSTPPYFHFSYRDKPYEKVLQIQKLTLSVDAKTLLDDVTILVNRGEKVAVTGDNGTGKSTLIREIMKGNPAIQTSRFTKIAYYDQENANLNPNQTVLEELWGRFPTKSQTEIRKILAQAKLEENDIEKLVSQLSGGERAKLALAVFETTEGNFLILDEPTNHLDLPAREALEKALVEFDGTLLFVSHDRYFIQAIADHILELENKKVNSFSGSYKAYLEYKKTIDSPHPPIIQKQKPESKSAMTREQKNAEIKRKNRIREIEKLISDAEKKESELNESLTDPLVTSNYALLTEKCKELDKIKSEIEQFYLEYDSFI